MKKKNKKAVNVKSQDQDIATTLYGWFGLILIGVIVAKIILPIWSCHRDINTMTENRKSLSQQSLMNYKDCIVDSVYKEDERNYVYGYVDTTNFELPQYMLTFTIYGDQYIMDGNCTKTIRETTKNLLKIHPPINYGNITFKFIVDGGNYFIEKRVNTSDLRIKTKDMKYPFEFDDYSWKLDEPIEASIY